MNRLSLSLSSCLLFFSFLLHYAIQVDFISDLFTHCCWFLSSHCTKRVSRGIPCGSVPGHQCIALGQRASRFEERSCYHHYAAFVSSCPRASCLVGTVKSGWAVGIDETMSNSVGSKGLCERRVIGLEVLSLVMHGP